MQSQNRIAPLPAREYHLTEWLDVNSYVYNTVISEYNDDDEPFYLYFVKCISILSENIYDESKLILQIKKRGLTYATEYRNGVRITNVYTDLGYQKLTDNFYYIDYRTEKLERDEAGLMDMMEEIKTVEGGPDRTTH